MNDQQPAVIVKDLYKSFKLPHEQHSGIKQLLLNFAKRKKGYEVQHVLDDISFEIKKGEFFGIVGRNGSGKSTLLKLLAGIYAPDKGLVQINGSLTPFIELGVGFNPELTGRENVFLNGALLGFGRKEMEAMYDDIVEFAELERFMDQKLKNYSSGMQVRLAFSIAIRANTDTLILDEVLAVGDAAFQQKCFSYFEQLKNKDKTIVFVTHDMSAVQRFCDRALFLDNGVIREIGTPAQIADLYMEENFPQSENAEGKSMKQFLDIEISNDPVDKGVTVIEMSYAISEPEEVYCGFSIVNEGITIAEINNMNTPSSGANGTFVYHLNTAVLNPGLYEISATLFSLKDKTPIVRVGKRARFVVRGSDLTRGGSLKLEDSWRA